MEIQFFPKNYRMSTSFGKTLVTLQVTTKMRKVVDNACLWRKKLNFYFLKSLLFGTAGLSDPLTKQSELWSWRLKRNWSARVYIDSFTLQLQCTELLVAFFAVTKTSLGTCSPLVQHEDTWKNRNCRKSQQNEKKNEWFRSVAFAVDEPLSHTLSRNKCWSVQVMSQKAW